MAGRLTICNMAVETGAKAGLCRADRETVKYLAAFGIRAEEQVPESPHYVKEILLDLSGLVPLVATGHRVDHVQEVAVLAGQPLDQVFVGTCTNGRYEDLLRFSRIVKGRQVKVRTIVVPASRLVLERITAEGILGTWSGQAASWARPAAAPAWGPIWGCWARGDLPLHGEPELYQPDGCRGEILLSSVATAAASALAGELTVPEVADGR